LIVDDEAATRTLFRLMLKPYASWRVLEAGSGQGAIAIAEAERPDVILLDVMMPDVDGIEVCARLREQPHLRASKIVMLTVLQTRSVRDAAVGAGADEFWTKPISPQALRCGLARLLGGGTPAADVPHPLNSRSLSG
jgi:CheY-like chemotaxis protein